VGHPLEAEDLAPEEPSASEILPGAQHRAITAREAENSRVAEKCAPQSRTAWFVVAEAASRGTGWRYSLRPTSPKGWLTVSVSQRSAPLALLRSGGPAALGVGPGFCSGSSCYYSCGAREAVHGPTDPLKCVALRVMIRRSQ